MNDMVVVDNTGKITPVKSPTTPQDDTIGVLDRVEKASRETSTAWRSTPRKNGC